MSGPTIKRGYLQAIVERVNALEADMVAITGDLVDGWVPELAHHVAPLAGLISRHGTFFVTGNHEYYSGAHAWIDELRRLGLSVLMNEHVVLQHGERPLVLAGVADFSAHHFDEAHRSDPQAAMAGAPADARCACCWRTSRAARAAAATAGFHLQFSGHTHGGQFWPWNFFVRLQQPFTAGLHRCRTCGSTPAAAPATGARPSGWARLGDHPAATGGGMKNPCRANDSADTIYTRSFS